jgi:DNA polymerase-3 subunit delta'
MSDLSGHEEPWRAWRAAMAGERMHHGWILAGKRGLGKASFALAAAAELVAEPGTHQPPPETHPDIFVLSPLPANDDEARKRDEGKPYTTKRNISVDQIRQMQARLFTRPTLGARRAVIIDSADDLEKGAVNALLKSLEEPPVGTFFLLVAHRLGRLLPTVRSRCLIVRFPELGEAEVGHALDHALPHLDSESRRAAIAAAGGSPGAAFDFAEQDLGKLHPLFERLLREGDPDFALRSALGAAIGQRPDRERLLAAIEAARMVMAGALRDHSGAARMHLIDAHEALVRLAAQAPTHNYDPALLVMEIGGLLANVARTREGAE